jgi:hypothetical protein
MIRSTEIKAHISQCVPSSAYVTWEEDSPGGLCTIFRPTNPNAAEMRFWLDAQDETVGDLLLGRAYATEIELIDDAHLLSLIDAVIVGHIKEKIWCIGGSVAYSKSEIWFEGRSSVVRNGIPFLYPSWWRHRYAYEAYIPVSAAK